VDDIRTKGCVEAMPFDFFTESQRNEYVLAVASRLLLLLFTRRGGKVGIRKAAVECVDDQRDGRRDGSDMVLT
jgi:hypothetical protein